MFKNSKVFTALVLSSVGFGVSANAHPTMIETIQVANTVPANQVSRLQTDIAYLKTLNFSGADPELKTLMGISDVNPTTLFQWLEARVHYLVDENLDLQTSLSIAKQDYNYQNPTVLPQTETPTATPADNGSAGSVFTVMSNIGGAIYMAGKENGYLIQMNIPGLGKKAVTSPRTGIVKVGAGLFAKLFPDSITPDSKPYIAMRMSVMFHEAHHSDGNGLSLGFFHATCPSGTYQGYAACDRNLNGPYQIQAKFVNSLITACTDCSAGDTKAMQVYAADSASRQITFTPDPNAASNNAMMVTALQEEISTCQLFTQMNVAIPTTLNCNITDLQNQITAIQATAGTPQGTPSTVWDATPEGV